MSDKLGAKYSSKRMSRQVAICSKWIGHLKMHQQTRLQRFDFCGIFCGPILVSVGLMGGLASASLSNPFDCYHQAVIELAAYAFKEFLNTYQSASLPFDLTFY